MSRLARFVRAARALLWMQVAAAAIATALGIWALVSVRELALERDRLLAEMTELRASGPQPAALATPSGPAPTALDSEARAPAIMPVFVPIVQGPEVPEIPPVDIPPPSNVPGPAQPAPAPTPGGTSGQACTDNPDQPRCRPGRWSRRDAPVVTRPVPPPRDATPRQGTDTPPR